MVPGIYIRMGRLSHDGKGYGDRVSVLLSAILQPSALRDYSLIIPILMDRNDIPSLGGKNGVRQYPWFGVECRRFGGALDMDTDFVPNIQGGTAPLFADQPDSSVGLVTKHTAKLRFVERMERESRTFGEMANLCPRFKILLELAVTLAAHPALIVYYSGGAGFRVLCRSLRAWFRVLWGDSPGYAETYVKRVLREEVLTKEPLNLPPAVCDMIAQHTDRSIYERDKGTKPDLMAHFETGLWPRRIPTLDPESCYRWRVTGQNNIRDRDLSLAIEQYWVTVLTTVPRIEECPWLRSTPVPTAKQ